MANKKKEIVEVAPLAEDSFAEIPEDVEVTEKIQSTQKTKTAKPKDKETVSEEPAEKPEPKQAPKKEPKLERETPRRAVKLPPDGVIVAEEEMKESKNEVIIVGTIVNHGLFNRNSSISITVATGDGSRSNFPNIIFHGAKPVKSLLELIENSGSRPKVSVKAFVSTARKQTDNGVRHFQDIIGKEAKLIPDRLKQALSNNSDNVDPAERNEVVLVGEIISKHTPKKDKASIPLTLMTLRVASPSFSQPSVTFFNRAHDIAQKMELGDHVAIVGMIQTRRRFEKGKKTVYHQNIVGTHLDWYDAVAV